MEVTMLINTAEKKYVLEIRVKRHHRFRGGGEVITEHQVNAFPASLNELGLVVQAAYLAMQDVDDKVNDLLFEDRDAVIPEELQRAMDVYMAFVDLAEDFDELPPADMFQEDNNEQES
jgi:hypothetical protein